MLSIISGIIAMLYFGIDVIFSIYIYANYAENLPIFYLIAIILAILIFLFQIFILALIKKTSPELFIALALLGFLHKTESIKFLSEISFYNQYYNYYVTIGAILVAIFFTYGTVKLYKEKKKEKENKI